MKGSVPPEWRTKAPRLKAIAEWVNTNTSMFAEVIEGYCNTDQKIPGTRLRRQGKGRTGNRLQVWKNAEHKTEMARLPYHYMYPDRYAAVRKYPIGPLLDHNAAETYRQNSEVVRWLVNHLEKTVRPARRSTP